ncbi:MAG: tetratricopeptide repeat protein [Hyphomonadaceae bacterium]
MTTRGILFGAGLSLPAGLPLANHVIAAVLHDLGCDQAEVQSYLSSRVPFELFMQTLRERTNIDPLLNVYATGAPTFYHHALAVFAKRGTFNTFVTTNFDTLLEQAFEMAGMREKMDFLIYREAESFRRIRWDSARPIIIKLHGSVEDTTRLGATLDKVASRKSANSVARAVVPLFGGVRFKRLYIAGYSCSDVFDIVPTINSIELQKTSVVFISHGHAKSGVPRWVLSPALNAKFTNGAQLTARTDAVLRRVGRKLSFPQIAMPKKGAADASSLVAAVAVWNDQIQSDERKITRLYTLGRLKIHAHQFSDALTIMTRANEQSIADGQLKWVAETHLNAGICHYRMGEFSRAALAATRAIRTAKGIGYHRVHGNAAGNLGNAFYSLRRLASALRWQERAAAIAKGIAYKQLEANSYGNIGIIYEEWKQYDTAISFHRRASHLAQRIGDAIGTARHAGNIALCLNRLSKFEEAKPFAQFAFDQSRLSGQRFLEAAALGELFRSEEYNDADLAYSYLERAIRVAEDVGDHIQATKFHEWGEALCAKRNWVDRRSHHRSRLPHID